MRWERMLRKTSLTVFLFAIAFAYGVGVGYYRWQPFEILTIAKSQLDMLFSETKIEDQGKKNQEAVKNQLDSPIPEKEIEYQGEQELLQRAFTDQIISEEKLFSPITSLEGIHHANQRIFMPVNAFDTAYETLIVSGANYLKFDNGKTTVLEVRFLFEGREYSAYAYGEMSAECGQGKTASLVIPGTGLNQSSVFYLHRSKNIINVLKDSWGGDVFTFIKPNEDILAWHNGKAKLSNGYIINYHLNRGGSYSSSYIIQSLAVSKYLSDCYQKILIAGLSQGGSATLLNALQSNPEVAIIASGYSMINNTIEPSGFNQIIIPSGFSGRISNIHVLKADISTSRTQFFFSWGRQEGGTYKMEANERKTCDALKPLSNVTCIIHDGAHVFPVEEIRTFLQRIKREN